NGYATHSDNFNGLRRLAPDLDQGLYALVTDLHERGLAEDVLVVVWGEFGRTPKIGLNRQNGPSGREHHCEAGFALMIGGGLPMGQAIGGTGPPAQRSRGRAPHTPQNVLATVYSVLGIDPEMTFPDHSGRPMYLLDERQVIRELS